MQCRLTNPVQHRLLVHLRRDGVRGLYRNQESSRISGRTICTGHMVFWTVKVGGRSALGPHCLWRQSLCSDNVHLLDSPTTTHQILQPRPVNLVL